MTTLTSAQLDQFIVDMHARGYLVTELRCSYAVVNRSNRKILFKVKKGGNSREEAFTRVYERAKANRYI